MHRFECKVITKRQTAQDKEYILFSGISFSFTFAPKHIPDSYYLQF